MALPIRPRQAETTGWDPWEELNRFNQQLSQYLSNWGDPSSSIGEGFIPMADVEESDDAYLVEVELPGVKREDVSLEVSGRRVTVSGERKERERVGILRKRTRSVGRFQYQVTLPGDVDEAGVEASMDQGVLTVRVPKAASERPRRIEVK